MNSMIFIELLILFKVILARGPPTLLPGASNFITMEVNENESLELHCPVTVTPELAVQWSKNGEDLDPIWSSSNLLIRRFLLKIHHTHSIDSGLYKCNVVNGFGYIQAQFQVNVKPNETITKKNNEEENIISWNVDSIDGEAPEFLSRNSVNQTELTKVIQPESTTVQLKCLATGKPTPEIRWKKNGKILSEDEYGITQSQILTIKDLRQSDTGNYTCEVFNSFGTINATFHLIVTEKLQFFGNDPENISVELGGTAILHCRVQTTDSMSKIQWLKKIDIQQLFRPDAIVFGSEQYENIEQSKDQHYSNGILSKSLIFSHVTMKETGQYLCLIQNDKTTNYKKTFIHLINHNSNIISSSDKNLHLIYVILIPLIILAFILMFIFFLRRQHGQHSQAHSLPDPMKIRTTTTTVVPSTTSNDYLADSIDSIPISRKYQSQRYVPSNSSDLASLTSSNLYYARIQSV